MRCGRCHNPILNSDLKPTPAAIALKLFTAFFRHCTKKTNEIVPFDGLHKSKTRLQFPLEAQRSISTA
jgi:hypothetical protein